MGIFGSFSFGRLIKTFLPGYLLFLAICMDIDIVLMIVNVPTKIYPLFIDHSALMIAVSIPLCIILGILSNTLSFIYVNKNLIEKVHEKQNPELYKLERDAFKGIKSALFKRLALHHEHIDNFSKFINVKAFMQNKVSVENFMYIDDSFWYYQEFQVNILLAIVVLTPSLLVGWLLLALKYHVNLKYIVLFSVLLILLIYLLIKTLITAARLNYDYFKRKNLSLLLGGYYYSVVNEKIDLAMRAE